MRLMSEYQSDEKCREYLEALRWPKGVRCPRCQSPKVSHVTTRHQYECTPCGYHFSVTAGTIFHDSHLPLSKWLAAVYLIVESKKGISANQIKRTLTVSYKTAWYLCHRIRAAVREINPQPLTGTVEADELYVGGRRSRGRPSNKTTVLGAIQRGGQIRLRVERRVDQATLRQFLRDHMSPTAPRLITDEHRGYIGSGDHDTTHETVNHSAKEWVRGDVHTNTIEGAFSLFERSIVGAYHHLSAKHMDAYLDEFEFRYNNRHNRYLFRDTLRRLLGAETMPYRKLVGTEA